MCHKTCDHLASPDARSCPAPGSPNCHNGCHCPAGTVKNNGACIKETDCPCYYQPHGKYYQVCYIVTSHQISGILCKSSCKITLLLCHQFGEKINIGEQCVHAICSPEKGIIKIIDLNCQNHSQLYYLFFWFNSTIR